MKVVVYFRQAGATAVGTYPLITHWAEDEDEQPVPLFSQFDMEAMADAAPEILVQLQSANRWLKEKRGVVVASFTETKDGSGRRPSYGAARKAASRERATILIATTKALAGRRFAPISIYWTNRTIGPLVELRSRSRRNQICKHQKQRGWHR